MAINEADLERDLWLDPIEALERLFPDYRPSAPWVPLDRTAVEEAGDGILLFKQIPAVPIEELPLEWPAQEDWGSPGEEYEKYHYHVSEPEGDFPDEGLKLDEDGDVFGEEDIFEKCAWYVPFHWKMPDWGIHLRMDCWCQAARDIYKTCPRHNTVGEAYMSAYAYFFLHELFHHVTEVAAVIMESVNGNPRVYQRYYRNGYKKTFLTPWCFEEALANRYLYGRHAFARLDRDWLFHRLIRQPAGYRNFALYKAKNFWRGRRRLASQMLQAAYRPSPSAGLPVPQTRGGVAYPLENLFET